MQHGSPAKSLHSQSNFLDHFCGNFSTWAGDFYVSACRVANPSRSWYVQRCSQRQVSNPQTSVTVLTSKSLRQIQKSMHSIQNFPHKNSESNVHRHPTVGRTETVFSPGEYAAVSYEQLYYIDCFMIELGTRRISFHKDTPTVCHFQSSATDPCWRFALAVASLWYKFLQPWSKWLRAHSKDALDVWKTAKETSFLQRTKETANRS